MSYTTIQEFRKLCPPAVTLIVYRGLHSPCEWLCTACGTHHSFSTAHEIVRKQFPCRCMAFSWAKTVCPPDIELLEFAGRTKDCRFKCVRCGTEHIKNFQYVAKKVRAEFAYEGKVDVVPFDLPKVPKNTITPY